MAASRAVRYASDVGDVHPSIPPGAHRNAGAVRADASDEPAFDAAAMCAIMACRAEADASRRCRMSLMVTPREQILPIFRAASENPSTVTPRKQIPPVFSVPPATILVRVREGDSATSPVREIIATTSIKIEIVTARCDHDGMVERRAGAGMRPR